MITSTRGKKMLSYCPQLYAESTVFLSHLEARGIELDVTSNIFSDIKEQFSVNTATWGLRYWEETCGLPVNDGVALEIRRARVMARFLRLGGMRPVDFQEALAALGFPVFVEELFRNVTPLPIYNGSKIHGTAYRTGAQWAMFRLRLSISDFRDFLPADREEITRLVDEIKPAHMALAGMDLLLPMIDNIQPVSDQSLIVTAMRPTDLFLRAGLRHAGVYHYQVAPQHDARFLYNRALLHNRLAPGAVQGHHCEDEAASLGAVLQIADIPSLLARHIAWPRRDLRYGASSALDQLSGTGCLRITDQAAQATEVMVPTVAVNLAERFNGELLAHGPVRFPGRDGSLLYHSGVEHRTVPLRSGRSKYGNHLSRLLGPRRDGRSRYGRNCLEQVGPFGLALDLADRQSVGLKVRNGHFFYRDTDVLHGPGPASLESPVFSLQVIGSDLVPLPADQTTASAKVVLAKDGYPGCRPQHGAPDQARHDSRSVHRLGSYAWTGERYSGRLYHASAPLELTLPAQAKVSISDTATGYYLYGGTRALHHAGGPRWRHLGNTLRKPFALHGAAWLHDGSRRYLEARARYGDRAALRDGLDRYGVFGGLHDGTTPRRPVTLPEDLRLVARRGYRRIAV